MCCKVNRKRFLFFKTLFCEIRKFTIRYKFFNTRYFRDVFKIEKSDYY